MVNWTLDKVKYVAFSPTQLSWEKTEVLPRSFPLTVRLYQWFKIQMNCAIRTLYNDDYESWAFDIRTK